MDTIFSRRLFVCLVTAVAVLVLAGCAASHRPVQPSMLSYQDPALANDRIEVSYLYDVEALAGNKRYANKEWKYNYSSVALRIKNVSSEPIILTDDNFRIGTEKTEMTPVNRESYTSKVRQISGTYLLHALWGPWSYSHIENPPQGVKKSEFRYIPIGLLVGIVNMAMASSANVNLRETLDANQIYGKEIAPGEIFYGIVILNSASYLPLQFEYNDLKAAGEQR